MAQEQEYLVHDILKYNTHQLLFESDFSLAEKEFFEQKKGRPFGGTLWIIRNNLKIKDYFILSGQISKVVIELNSLEVLVIYGVWLGFDDSKNRQNSNQSFLNNLSILEGEISMNLATETAFVIVGDFNADLHRNRRFDKHLCNFLNNNSLVACENLFKSDDLNYTYKKGKNFAYIDHAICLKTAKFITGYGVLYDPDNVSDHQPIKIEIEYNKINETSTDSIPILKKTKIHKFNWTKEFCDLFNKNLSVLCQAESVNHLLLAEINQSSLDQVHNFLTKTLLKAARLAEIECDSLDLRKKRFKLKLNKVCHLNKEFVEIKQKIKNVYTQRKILGYKQLNEETVLRKLKKYLRQIQKLIIQTMNSKKTETFEYLFKCKRNKFWSQIAKFRKKKPIKSSQVNIEAFEEYYSDCFNSKNAEQLEATTLLKFKSKIK